MTPKSNPDSRLIYGFETVYDIPSESTFSQGKIKAEAIMLDLDGTIIDSVGIYYKIVEKVLEKLRLPQISPEQISKANENGIFLWEKLFPREIFADNPDLKDEAWAIARKIAPAMFNGRIKMLPGVADTLKLIAAKGYKLAIVTSTPRQNMESKLQPLARSETLHLFQEIITADDADHRKPAADPLLECTKRLNVDPREGVYVGDTLSDIQAGKAAGTITVGVLTGFDNQAMLHKEQPDAIIASLSDINEVIVI